MYHHVKKLMYTVRVDAPDPKFGNMLLELLVAFNQPATAQCPFMYHCHILEHEDAGMMGQYVCL
jgi:FtsP/CotA-like multicopper oxidase with cupredoxin domain